MIEEEPPPVPRSAKPLCLGRMACLVLRVLKTHEPLSFQGVADAVLGEIGDHPLKDNSDRTLRRRVYDVLNVFLAAGVAAKEGKNLIWARAALAPSVPSVPQSLRASIQMRETELIDKVSVYVAWKLIVDHNRARAKPLLAVPVWKTFFVGFRTCSGGYNREFDGKRIELHAESPPFFYSPLEVIMKLGFTRDQRKAVVLADRNLRDTSPIIFPDGGD